MTKRVLVHPIKVKRVMTEFVENATTLNKKCTMVKSNTFATTLTELEDIFITYDEHNIDFSIDKGTNVLVDMRNRNSITKGFANITLVLLHELGHNETCKQLSRNYNREQDLNKCYQKAYNQMTKKYNFTEEELFQKSAENKKLYNELLTVINYYYQRTEPEWLATEWALNWLKDKTNRRKAKVFEKQFFNCFSCGE